MMKPPLQIANWLSLATSSHEEELEQALLQAEDLSTHLQDEILYWVVLNSNFRIKTRLIALLEEEHLQLLQQHSRLRPFMPIRPFPALFQTTVWAAKKVIFQMYLDGEDAAKDKIKFIHQYLEVTSASLDEAQYIANQISQPLLYPDATEAWMALATSFDEANLEIALETAGVIADQIQDELLCWFIYNYDLSYKHRLYLLLTKEYQDLLDQLQPIATFIKDDDYYAYTQSQDLLAKRIILDLKADGRSAVRSKIRFIQEYKEATGLGLLNCKLVADQVLAIK